MSYLRNDAATFVDDMIDGFVAAHGDVVRRVDGGVVRAAGTRPGEVAVVIGGGSGHYPAFAGLVGPGLAHGAAMGNVFASPSTHQVRSVATAAAADAGVLLSYGNYAGDVINFDAAQEQLRAAGIQTRTVVVTDDISSAPADDRNRRRGVAGDLCVFRAAAWAAEQGRSLDEVWALADRANARTRTLGVAFSGCTLPGAEEPLFTVPRGVMAIGMGIHGEPGLEERPLESADGVAQLLVERLLADGPTAGGRRVGVLVNGLGSVKAEELYLLYRSIAPRLERAGLDIVAPEVGEFATSFEMAGVSLTVCWLDEELEQAWSASSGAPGYRRGTVVVSASSPAPTLEHSVEANAVDVGSPDSRAAATLVARALRAARGVVDEHADELGRLDSVAGDGDHGIGMRRGVVAASDAAARAVAAGAGAASTLAAASDAWADRAGGTSGALWSLGLAALGRSLGDDGTPSAADLVAGVEAATDAIAAAGKVEPGDKTMLDALQPFAQTLARDAGNGLAEAALVAAVIATQSASDTAQLQPRAGRARTHTDRSVGSPDPGAVSFALIVSAVASTLAGDRSAAS